MKIAVGSMNPAKIAAVKNVVSKIWNDAEVIPVEAPSKVSPQPTSDDEAVRGALNRANFSLIEIGADIGIGIEGCTVETEYGTFVTGWSVALSKEGEMGVGSGIRLLLPEAIASMVRAGEELGQAVDRFTGEENTRQGRGAIGVLTSNLMTRTTATEQSIICALARFMNPRFYRPS